jgi:hypothetical protein
MRPWEVSSYLGALGYPTNDGRLMYEFCRWDRERYLVTWGLLDIQKWCTVSCTNSVDETMRGLLNIQKMMHGLMDEFCRWDRDRYLVIWGLLDIQKMMHGLMYEFCRWDRERYLVIWGLLVIQKMMQGLMYEFCRWDRERYVVIWGLLDRKKKWCMVSCTNSVDETVRGI